MTARKPPTLKEKLAAFVLTMKVEENGQLVPLVTRDEAKNMTTEHLLSLLQWDHSPVPVATAVALGMTADEYNHPTNLTPMPIVAHRIKTAKTDVPTIAKGNRISAAHEDFQRRLLRKVGATEGADETPKRKTKAVIQGSRNSPWKRKINGRVERR